MRSLPIRRWFEQSYPFGVACVAAWLSLKFGLTFDPDKTGNQLSAGINISAILMGFLGTAKAMLLSFSSKKYKEIKSNTHLWNMLLAYFQRALMASLFLCAYSIILFSLDFNSSENWVIREYQLNNLILPIWIFLASLSFLTFFRVLRVIFALLKSE